MTESVDRGRQLMQSVILLIIAIGIGSQVFHVPPGTGFPYRLSTCIGLVGLVADLYNGRRRFRIPFGVLLLASAAAFLYVGLTRLPRGSAASSFSMIASIGLIYCFWVILLSRDGRRYILAREQWLRSITVE